MSPLITKAQRARLLENGRRSASGENIDPKPVVKLFTPDANATWLLTEIDPHDQDHAFGLCDLGLGFPELGWVSLNEISGLRGRLGLPVERDRCFKPIAALSRYASAASAAGHIVESLPTGGDR